MLKIVQLTTDNREQQNDYQNPVPHFGPAPQALLEGLSLLPDVEVHVVSCLREGAASPAKVFGNIYYHSAQVPRIGWMSTLYQGCLRATRKIIREIDPDIVHGQGTEKECSLCAVHSGYPSVMTIHGNMAELNRLGDTFRQAQLFGFLASKLETYSLGKTGGVFCNSEYTNSLVSRRARKTWLVPNAIRSEFFRKPKRLDQGDKPILLNVGLLCERKRQLEILNIAEELHREGHAFHLIFVGGVSQSDYTRAFQEALRKGEKEGYASHRGILNQEALIDLMDQASGFIHFPSEEAFGLVVAEAIGRGLKFFGSNLGGIKDITTGISSAELHDSPISLKNAIAKWILSGASRASESAETIRQRYSPIVVARQHLEIYKEFLKS